MSLEKVDALVVRTVDFSESSLIVDAFTRELGKIHGIAKGAKRLKNPFETSLDILSSIRLCFIRKNSNALDLFTEASLCRRFRPTSKNYRGLYAGYYVAELLEYSVADYQPYPDLWILADSTLENLQYRTNVEARVAYFECGLLDAFGEFPSLRFCVNCGERLPLERISNLARRVFFAVDAGGVVCTKCRARKLFTSLIPTTVGALKVFEVACNGSKEAVKIAKMLEGWRRDVEEKSDEISWIDKVEREKEVGRAFSALDDECLAPFGAFPEIARREYRDLVELYICRTLRRRLRLFDYLPFAVGYRDTETKCEDQTGSIADENGKKVVVSA